MGDKPKVTLQLIEDRRSLGQRVLSRIRGRIDGEPQGMTDEASQWWFMLGWVMRGCAVELPDDEKKVEEAWIDYTLATIPPKKGYDA
jgi:hypothetical protein